MKKGLDKFIKVYMEILYALSSIFYAGFCFCVLVQVISRNFLPNAPSWTEELARYSFIYMVAFGVGLAALKPSSSTSSSSAISSRQRIRRHWMC
mgnify:CR=1 FL=1